MSKIINLFKWDWKDLARVLLGSLFFCIAINFFVVPNHLYTGGVLGLSQLIRSIVIDTFDIKSTFDFSNFFW